MSQLFAQANATAPAVEGNGLFPTSPPAGTNQNGGPMSPEQINQANAAFAAAQAAYQATLNGQPAPQPAATAPQAPAYAPPAPPAPGQSADQRMAAIMNDQTIVQNPTLLRPALDLALMSPSLSAQQVVAQVVGMARTFGFGGAAPGQPGQQLAAPVQAPAAAVYVPGHGFMIPAAAPPMNGPGSGQSPTAAFAQQAQNSGTNNLASAYGGAAHVPGAPGAAAPGAAPGTDQSITLENCGWDTAVKQTNAKRGFDRIKSHIATDPGA